MATPLASIDTQHEDMIHDCQLDYYSRKLATCSSDRTIKIFEVVENSTPTLLSELKGHEGPVWQISWAHPKFGVMLASCSYDRRACVWKETSPNSWNKVYEYDKHEASVNSIAWAPHEYGLCFAACSSDGTISVHTYKGGQENSGWDVQRINAHAIGVNSVSWQPAISSSLFNSSGSGTQTTASTTKRFVSGGCDNQVKIWSYFESGSGGEWRAEDLESVHTDWVRDVAWAPNIGIPSNCIASCSQDGSVVIWSQELIPSSTSPSSSPSPWTKKFLKFPDVVWRVSWSITGNILAVSGGDNKVTLWKENTEGEWKCISSLEDDSAGTGVQ